MVEGAGDCLKGAGLEAQGNQERTILNLYILFKGMNEANRIRRSEMKLGVVVHG